MAVHSIPSSPAASLRSPQSLDLPIFLFASDMESGRESTGLFGSCARRDSKLARRTCSSSAAPSATAPTSTFAAEPSHAVCLPPSASASLISDVDVKVRLYASERHARTLEAALTTINRRSAQDRQRMADENQALARRVRELEQRKAALEGCLVLCEKLVLKTARRAHSASARDSDGIRPDLNRLQSFVRGTLDQIMAQPAVGAR